LKQETLTLTTRAMNTWELVMITMSYLYH